MLKVFVGVSCVLLVYPVSCWCVLCSRYLLVYPVSCWCILCLVGVFCAPGICFAFTEACLCILCPLCFAYICLYLCVCACVRVCVSVCPSVLRLHCHACNIKTSLTHKQTSLTHKQVFLTRHSCNAAHRHTSDVYARTRARAHTHTHTHTLMCRGSWALMEGTWSAVRRLGNRYVPNRSLLPLYQVSFAY